MQKRWRIHDQPDHGLTQTLAQSLNVSEIVAKMLVNREISDYSTAEDFFNPKLEKLHDPFLMADLEAAVHRLNKSIENGEKIMVYGDYDVDGTTAVSVFYSVITAFTKNCVYYIPDRYKEGYGVSEVGIRYAAEIDVKLIVTLDCGVKSVDKAALAKELGIDMIICDHHNPGDELPDALVLDPKRTDCNYPYKELSGCGVGFKLLQGLFIYHNKPMEQLYGYLDLLAISIGADIVPITGENRVLAHWGLKLLNANPRPGIKKMIELAQRPFPLDLTDVVFTIAPRINAAGRLGDAKKAVELILSPSLEQAQELAMELQSVNEDRKTLDETIKHEALSLLEERVEEFPTTNVVFQKGWHKGVIGIVASRLIEQRYRPTIVLTQVEENGTLTGSARSIPGVNIHDVLDNCSSTIIQFGGHYFAAGLTLELNQLENFRTAFEAEVAKLVTDEMLVPEQSIEAEVNFTDLFLRNESLYEVPRFKRILERFEPHGPGNMKPVFMTRNVFVHNSRLLKGQHLKLTLFQPNTPSCKLEAIGFFMPELYEICQENQPLEIAYTLETNTWNDKSRLQLNIKDIRMM
jgi:single-stranded-DNA-specific exonuclease